MTHIQNPYRSNLAISLCKQTGRITDNWFKVSCPECLRLMIKMMRG